MFSLRLLLIRIDHLSWSMGEHNPRMSGESDSASQVGWSYVLRFTRRDDYH